MTQPVKRLYRSRNERMLAGVCGGLAEYFTLDPTIVRLVTVLGVFLTQGIVLFAYIAMALIVPEEPLPGSSYPTVVPPADRGDDSPM